MSKRQLTDIPLFPEKDITASKVPKKEIGRPPGPRACLSQSASQTGPSAVPCPPKPRKFPKRPVCTDDTLSSCDPDPFVSSGISSSALNSPSSKAKRSLLNF